ncbi:serine protease, partial [Nostoc sp. UCD120]|uniref:S1 family peptidase n=1 Tax=Nostoc sp. UCD120 TaxID=2681312 RepID=UPI0016275727
MSILKKNNLINAYKYVLTTFFSTLIVISLVQSSGQNEDSMTSTNESCPPQPKSEQQLRNLARSVTVKVLTDRQTWGSGILISKNNGLYKVITNKHIVAKARKYEIQTANNKQKYPGQLLNTVNFGNNDLAELQFASKDNYVIACLENTKLLTKNVPVFVAGYPLEANPSVDNGFVFKAGNIGVVLDKDLLDYDGIGRGYRIGYTNEIEKGMSGGPVVNSQGSIVGINGRHKSLRSNHPYPLYSWAIPIGALTNANSQFISQKPNSNVSLPSKANSNSNSSINQLTVQIYSENNPATSLPNSPFNAQPKPTQPSKKLIIEQAVTSQQVTDVYIALSNLVELNAEEIRTIVNSPE